MVYVAVFLDRESREKLLKLVDPRHPNVFAHHVTVCFKPSQEQLKSFKLPERVEFEAISIVHDEKGQAVRVRGVPSQNEHPHITISCADGVKPVYSNELLKGGKVEEFDEPIGLVGVLDTFPRSLTTEGENHG